MKWKYHVECMIKNIISRLMVHYQIQGIKKLGNPGKVIKIRVEVP
jgi:hypothetical protein